MQNCNPFLYISLTMNVVLVNPRMYTQIHTPIVVQGGDGGGGGGCGGRNSSPEFLMRCSIIV